MLPFILEVVGHDLSNVTSHAGLPLVLEALRAVTPTRGSRRPPPAASAENHRTIWAAPAGLPPGSGHCYDGRP